MNVGGFDPEKFKAELIARGVRLGPEPEWVAELRKRFSRGRGQP